MNPFTRSISISRCVSSSQRRRPLRNLKAIAVASAALTFALCLPFAKTASAQVLVPNGCGALSGLPVPANYTLVDHSNDVVPLGNKAAGIPYLVPLVNNVIFVGTEFDDFIQGSNGVNDTICGRDGDDLITGGGGDDDLFGGKGNDELWGEDNSDFLNGGPGADYLYGDDPANSNIFDGADTLEGGPDNDHLFGGRLFDALDGGGGQDVADAEANGGVCTKVETRIGC